jgi:hypothetical protein
MIAIHEMVNRLPVTARSLEKEGVRIEDGRIVSRKYTGPLLIKAMVKNTVIRKTPESGAYTGVPVIVSPFRDEMNAPIGAIGIVDITGIFDLATLMEHQSAILKQVCGKDPCPLPAERTDAKR